MGTKWNQKQGSKRYVCKTKFLEVMDIALKYKIVEKIVQSEDEMVLNEIKALLNLSKQDFWQDLPEEVKQAVNKAKAELDDGKGIPHDRVMKEINTRFFE